MEVFTFEKSFLERLKEAEAVLSWEGAVMPASQVRSEWKSYVELKIEPAGKPPTHANKWANKDELTNTHRLAGYLEDTARHLRGSEAALSHYSLWICGPGNI